MEVEAKIIRLKEAIEHQKEMFPFASVGPVGYYGSICASDFGLLVPGIMV